jgi:hypothetical protein
VQAVAEVHDTPDRSIWAAPVGLGVGSIAHDFPFQASTKGPATATHQVAEVHDAALKPPVGLGVCSIAHDFPFQASTSVSWTPAPVV